MESATLATHLSFCAITDVGRVRTNNEDSFVAYDIAQSEPFAASGSTFSFDVGERGFLLAVSDGMGGAQAGEVASALVLRTLEESLSAADQPTDEDLRAAVERANAAVFGAAQDPSRRGMGATLTAVLLRGANAYIASVGDSRAYLLRGARFRQMTRDQSYVQVLMDAGILKPDEAESSPMKNVVLQSMGQKSDVQVALGRLELRRGDRLVLCSDGLTGHVKDEEIAGLVGQKDLSLDEITRQLVALALDRGGEDNITVVVADLSGERLSRAPVPESVTQTFQVLSEFEPKLGTPRSAGLSRDAGGGSRSSRPSDPESRPSAPPAPIAAPAEPTKSFYLSVSLVVLAVLAVAVFVGAWFAAGLER